MNSGNRRSGWKRDLTAVYAAMDASSVAILRHFAGGVPGGTVFEDDRVIVVAGAVDYVGPVHNAAIRKSPTEEPRGVIETASSFFAKKSRAFVLWASSHADSDLAEAAQGMGFRVRDSRGGAAGMYVETPFHENPVPSGVSLRRVEKRSHVTTFANVVGASFAARSSPQPFDASLSLFADPTVLLNSSVVAHLAEIDGRAFGAAMTLIEDGVGGLCWVSTLPHARGRGIASFLTSACANASFDAGADIVVLQSSSMGEAMYARMGFKEITRYQRLLSPEPSSHQSSSGR